MKKVLFVFLILFYFQSYCQKLPITEIEGIWIAENFYNSFENTKSILNSKKAFYFNYPVGLRFNSSEIKGNEWNVGYASLHGHSIFDEISDFIIVDNDTIREQGRYKLNLVSENENGSFKLEPLRESYESYSKTALSFENETITLTKESGTKINYIKIASEFNEDYKYPNPLDYYTRKTILEGDYTLKNSSDIILSENFTITPNGKITGSDLFKDRRVFYSTDVYCGPPEIDEIILFCSDSITKNRECQNFVIKLIDKNTIYLYGDLPRSIEEPERELENLLYKLGLNTKSCGVDKNG